MSRSRETANIIHGGTLLLDGDDPQFMIRQLQTSGVAADSAGVFFENADTTLSDFTRPFIRLHQDKVQIGAQDLTNGGYLHALVAFMKDGDGFYDLDLRGKGVDIKLVGDDYAVSGSYMAFRTATTSGTVAEAMRIAPSGNVLIGTSVDSGHELEVNGAVKATGGLISSVNPSIKFEDTDGAVDETLGRMYFWENGFLWRTMNDNDTTKTNLMQLYPDASLLLYGDLSIENGSSNVSSTGAIRLNNAHNIAWRNNANDGDKQLVVNSDDRLQFDGDVVASNSSGTEHTMMGDDNGKGVHTEWDDTNSRFKHHVSFNDGGGNFNIRVGHHYDSTGGNYVCSEASYPVGITIVQTSGKINFNFVTSSKAVNDTFAGWDEQYEMNATAFDFNDKQLLQAEIKDYGETAVVATGVTGSYTLNLANGNVYDLTLSGNTTFTLANPPASGTAGSLTLIVTKGAHAITWPGAVDWADGTAPTMGTGVNIVTFVTTDGGTTWYGMFAGKDFA